jgi:hypothetical protein
MMESEISVARGWKKQQRRNLHNLYTPENIFKTEKSRKICWEGQVARTEEIRNERNNFGWKISRRYSLGRQKH